MKQSKLFTKTRREVPKDETSKNASLLIRSGFIHKEASGVYSILPLGLKVFEKITNIVRKNMNELGASELHMSALQDPESWQKSGRWSDDVLDVWFKTNLKSGGEMGFGTTHEEPITRMMIDHIRSYKDLPTSVYQFQTKFRNELRAKAGIIRGREFLMKDLYSFSRTQKEHEDFYEKVKNAYIKIYEEVGLGEKTFLTFAAGGTFSKYSHEFQTLSDAGEDKIFISKTKKIAINHEVMNDAVLSDLGIDKNDLEEKNACEVGNIFSLGTKFSDPIGLNFVDETGNSLPVIMGSYGIGIGRVMGVVAEVCGEENSMVWPKNISPFDAHLVLLTPDNADAKNIADEIYQKLSEAGVEVLYDDRQVRAGEKLNDSDLIGIHSRIVVGSKTSKGNIEFVDRLKKENSTKSIEQILEYFQV